MVDPSRFVEALSSAGVTFATGVPDSLLKDVYDVIDGAFTGKRHVIAANEGNAVALAAGHHLASGGIPLVYLQNSGLGNAVNPLVSLAAPEVYALPLVLLIGWRGEPGQIDEPQHVAQGRATPGLLHALEVPFLTLDGDETQGLRAARWAVMEARRRDGPVALLVRKGVFAATRTDPPARRDDLPITRAAAIQAVVEAMLANSVVVASTGMISRELGELRRRLGSDASRDFLTVGSMGHASQIALGITTAQPGRPVVCLDGDGAAIMHMGGFATIGTSGARDLLHVVLNNGAHDSVGGQPTAGFAIDLTAVARACGYATAVRADSCVEAVAERVRDLQTAPGPAFLEVRVMPGGGSAAARPRETPVASKRVFVSQLRTVESPRTTIEDHLLQAMHYLHDLLLEPNTLHTVKPKTRFAIFRQAAAKGRLMFSGLGADAEDLFTVRRGEHLDLFRGAMNSSVPSAFLAFTGNKEFSKVWLAAHGLPVARGGVVNDVGDGLTWFDRLGRDVVVKPVKGTKGRGISVGLRSEADFRGALEDSQRAIRQRARQKGGTKSAPPLLVEETVRGLDLRVIVIAGTARAAVMRFPAHVVGDGARSVEELVEAKNRDRAENHLYLARFPLRLNSNALRVLRGQGLTPSSRPALGQTVFLTLAANISTGADSVSVFDLLHPEVLRLAEAAARTLGQPLYLGVDILLERLDLAPSEQHCVICEINSNAGPNATLYPSFGVPFDSAKAVLAHVLPDAQANPRNHTVELELTGIEGRDDFEQWLRTRFGTAVDIHVTDRDGLVHVAATGPFRRVERLANTVWQWRGDAGARIDGSRRVSRPFGPASPRIPTSSRPPRAMTTANETMLASFEPAIAGTADRDVALITKAFERAGWTATARAGGWFVVRKGAAAGVCYAVQASVPVRAIARRRFPLLRLLGDAGFRVPRHAVFSTDEHEEASAYRRRRAVPQRLLRASKGPRWHQHVTDEGSLAMAWSVGARGTRTLVLEDDVPGERVAVLVVAGSGHVLPLHGTDAGTGRDAQAEAYRRSAVAAVASLPGLDLALVWLRVDSEQGPKASPDWTLVEVDPEPALHRLDRLAPGTAAAAADRVVRELYLSDRSFWFGADDALASTDAT